MKTKGLIKATLALAMCLMLCIGLVTIPSDTVEAAGGTTRALLVAYPDANLGQGPYNDVMIMRAALINMGVRPEHIKIVSNEMGEIKQFEAYEKDNQLTRAKLAKYMSETYKGAAEGDTNIFYFSGHGSKNGQQGTFGTTNIVLSEYYATEDLAKDLVEHGGSARNVVLLDACNSGSIVNKSAELPVEVTDEQLQQDISDDFEKSVEVQSRSTAHTNNFLVITAASAREDSLGGTFGMLTRSLASGMGVTFKKKDPYTLSTVYYESDLDVNSSAMADQNKDNKITLSELYNHVYRDTAGSVPVVFPEKSDAVLFEYSAPATAYVYNMKVSGPDASGYVEGTFEYSGTGVPVVLISGYGMVYTSNGLYLTEYNIEPSLSKLTGNTYRFSANGLTNLRAKLLSINGTLVTYGFAVDVKRSADYYPLYRYPISITSASTGKPNIVFNNVSGNQPSRLLPGQQEYRLQIGFDRDCTVDLHIYDKNGNKIRTLANALPSKQHFTSANSKDMTMDFYWDGRDDSGKLRPGDGYEARAIARNNAGTSATIVESRLASLRIGTTPTGISINEQQNTVGQSRTIILTTSATPEDAYSGADWSSSNPDIATVSNKGVVKGVGVGDVTITATSRDNRALQATTQVNVYRYGWQMEEDGRFYYIGDGNQRVDNWQYIDGHWYLFNNTIMQKGWTKTGSSWYYLKSSGAMAVGWVKDGSNWYYLKDNGTMASGWTKVGGTWYHLKPNGVMSTGWLKDGGNWYYLKDNGTMTTGWQKIGGAWYYMQANGKMTTGWQQVAGKWYYLNSNGTMAYNTTVDGKYRLGANGVMY